MSAHKPDESSVSYDVVFSLYCHLLKFILIVTINFVPQISDDSEDVYTSLVFVLGSVSLFFVETQCILESIAESIQYEDPES